MANALTVTAYADASGNPYAYIVVIMDGSTVVFSAVTLGYSYVYKDNVIVIKDHGHALLTITKDNVKTLTGQNTVKDVFDNIINV